VGGAFQTSRDIFENPIWQNIVEFRLFFLIYGKATFIDGVKIGNVILKRGQWLRSYRNLQSDLEYVENRTIKKYSLSKIHRAVENLLKQERVRVERVELGTLFEVVNYATYQGLENYKSDIRNSNGTEMEQQRNGDRTEMEQRWNNNKNLKNLKNLKKGNKGNKSTYAENVTLLPDEYQKLVDKYGQATTIELIEILNNYKGSSGKKYTSDYMTMFSWVIKRYEADKQKKGKDSSMDILKNLYAEELENEQNGNG